jgi:hypothetical protein
VYRIYRVTCKLDPTLVAIDSSVAVSVFDERDFSQNNFEHIFLHKPQFVSHRGKPKLRNTINCVHTLRGVNDDFSNRINTWIRINKGFGVGKISFGFMDSNWTNLNSLKTEHGDFIETVPLVASTARVCSNLKLEGNRSVKCLNSHLGKVFNQFGLLEKLSSNDWYLEFFFLFFQIRSFIS